MWKSKLIILSFVGAVAGCEGSGDASRGEDESVALSSEEGADLVYLREEEKLARDVYTALEVPGSPFTNIRESEQRHMDAVGGLLARYAIADPVAPDVAGTFRDPSLQALHDDLVLRGGQSYAEALAVGVEIEELDLVDIAAQMESVEHADVATVLENLARGSRNHLRAFHAALLREGGSYTPKHLDAASFAEVVSTPREPGAR